jgi:hypothetical protein
MLSRNIFTMLQSRYIEDSDMIDDDDADFFVPGVPTEHVHAILSSTTGARVQQYLHYVMKKHKCIVEVDLGMCTALKNGMIGSQPSEQEVNNFSPFFCPLHNDNDRLTAAKLLRLEESAKNGKISQDDMELVTSQTISFAKDYNELKHMMWNFHVLTLCVLVTSLYFHYLSTKYGPTLTPLRRTIFTTLLNSLPSVRIICRKYTWVYKK